MTKLCFDIDFLIFDSAAASEYRYIKAHHIPSGVSYKFDNRTGLWSDWRKKTGGWIGEQNEMFGEERYKAEDFEIEDVQEVSKAGLPQAKRVLDQKIKTICSTLGVNDYFGFTGKGEVFRHKLATLLPYKGNRDNVIRPIYLDELKEYAVKKHNCEMVKSIEADDAFSIAVVNGYKKWKQTRDDVDRVVGIAEDKDSKQVEGFHFNPNKDTVVREIEGLGKLWLDAKGDVDGCGRMWLYLQISYGDASDHYKANCFSDKRWGEKNGYNMLKDCKTDKEAWQALVNTYKLLYPEPKKVIGWRGNEIEIDWLYVLQEVTSLAFMLRKPDDKIDVLNVLQKLGVKY